MGQFFTPDHIAKLMADICFDYEGAKNIIEQNGFVTLSEPTCGSGVMVIAAASALQKQGINYQQDLFAYATDISELCVYITYVQLSLYGIPAIVNCGDSLTSKVRFSLTTPLYFLNYWKFRKANTSKIKETQENIQNQNSLYTFKETVKNGNLQLSFW